MRDFGFFAPNFIVGGLGENCSSRSPRWGFGGKQRACHMSIRNRVSIDSTGFAPHAP